MEIRWGNKRKGKPRAVPGEVRENSAETIVRERRFGNLIDEIVANEAANGGFDNIQGKGKPLDLSGEVHENYYLHKVLKNANVLPEWLELQHKIRDSIGKLVDRIDRDPSADCERDIAAINQQIQKFNQICPSTIFQKPLITKDTVRAQQSRWE